MNHLDLVKLPSLMELTSGRSEILVGLLDGPVATNHPDLERAYIREIPGGIRGACTQTKSVACLHGTFVAGILCAKRSSDAPAICPNCTLLVRPIFAGFSEVVVFEGALTGGDPLTIRVDSRVSTKQPSTRR